MEWGPRQTARLLELFQSEFIFPGCILSCILFVVLCIFYVILCMLCTIFQFYNLKFSSSCSGGTALDIRYYIYYGSILYYIAYCIFYTVFYFLIVHALYYIYSHFLFSFSFHRFVEIAIVPQKTESICIILFDQW